jgi:hypothetical protein
LLIIQIKKPFKRSDPTPTVKTMNGKNIRDKSGQNNAFKIPSKATTTKAVSQLLTVKPTDK